MRNTKRVISMILVVCMLLSVLSVGAFAVEISTKPENGTTEGQPFPVGAGGSNNFRIPGIVTLNDGTLIAACDARWNHTGDGAGLDTIVAVSTDNGATWEHTFANYLGDNGNTFNNLSTCIIDPAIGTDGETAYLIADLFPAGIALNTSMYGPIATENGFDDAGHLMLRALSEDTIAIGGSGYNTMAGEVSRYKHYLDLETLKLYTYGVDGAEDTEITGYTVDAYFNITGEDGTNTNLFFSDSPYQPYPTDYLYLVTSEDGLTWSEPTLLNLQEDGEQTLLIGPGNGTYDAATDRMIFTAYEYTSGWQLTSLIWMDSEGNWSRTADATTNGYNDWSSEATAVVLDDGTVRCFYRDGINYLRYTDYVWDEAQANYVLDSDAYEVVTQATKTANNQISSIRYSEPIDGKDAILVSTANSDGRNRRNGYLYVFLLNEDNTMELAYEYDMFPGTDDYYAYSCITEMDDGNIALLYEGDDGGSGYGRVIFHEIKIADVVNRDNDARLDFVEFELLTGNTYTHRDNSGYYPNPDLSELNTEVATVEISGSETTTNAGQVLGSGANVDLDACRYTFTANDDGTYVVSNTTGGTTVYLNHYLSSGNNIPNITTAGNIAVLEGTVEGMFKLQAQVQEGGSGVARTLHFHAEASTPYWNRCGSDTSYKCQEYLFRKAEAGETASTEIPGYVQLTEVSEVEDGGQYLIAAKNDAGNWYVLNPTTSSTSLDHVAQIVGSTTVGYTELVFTGVGAGYTEVQIGSTVYRITVADLSTVEVTVPVGSSVTYTEASGNYEGAALEGLDTSIATVTLDGTDGTNDAGVIVTPVTSLTDGTYIIMNTRAKKLVTNESASASAAAGSMAGLALGGTTSTFDAATSVWTITAVDGGYTLQDPSGKYMTIASNAGGLADEANVIHMAYTNGTWTLEQNNAYLNDAGGAGTTASGWQNSAAATDAGSQFTIYEYAPDGAEPGTDVTITGVYPGTTGVLVGRTQYNITVTGTVIDVELDGGETATYMIDTDTLAVEPDASVATAEIVSYPAAQLGTDASYNGEFVDLADCLFTFTANEDGTYVISSTDAAGNTVYLEGYSSTNGYPVVSYATDITLGDGTTENSVTLYSYSASAAKTGYLFFWRDGKNYFDRVTSTGGFESGVAFHLYAQAEDGTYAAIAGKDAVVDGGQYLVVAENGDSKFVVYPTTASTHRYIQAAKMGNANAVTFTGVDQGETVARAGSTIFQISVAHVCHYEAVVTAPTCTAGGYTTYTCSCGDSYVADETPALGHDFENGSCTVCGAGVVVNVTTGETYTAVADALAAAKAGDTVKLLGDCTEEQVLVTPNVTLDLNGKTLTADYVVGFNSADVVDNVGTGKLIVAEKNVVLDEGNGMVPVYDGTGYILTKAGFAIRKDEKHEGTGIKVVAVASPVNQAAWNLLKDGAADNNLQVAIVLTWDNEQGTGSQKFVFTEEVVAAVYGSGDGTLNGYEKMFSMVITGVEGISNLKANIVLVSGTNVEYGNPAPVAVN